MRAGGGGQRLAAARRPLTPCYAGKTNRAKGWSPLAWGPAAAAAHPMAGPRPALTPRAHALTPRAGKTPKGKKGLAREAGARGFKNASAAALAPRKPLCAAAHAGGQPGPRLGCDSSRGPGELRRPRPQGGGGPRGQKGPPSYGGLFGPEHLRAACAAAAAPTGARPRGGPGSGPPRSRAGKNARVPPCQKAKSAAAFTCPCIFTGRCNALPPPGPGDSPSIGTAAGPAKRHKAGLLAAQCAAPPAQVGGVSGVECPERGRSDAGPTKGRGLGGGYTFQGCGNIGRYAVAPVRESGRALSGRVGGIGGARALWVRGRWGPRSGPHHPVIDLRRRGCWNRAHILR